MCRLSLENRPPDTSQGCWFLYTSCLLIFASQGVRGGLDSTVAQPVALAGDRNYLGVVQEAVEIDRGRTSARFVARVLATLNLLVLCPYRDWNLLVHSPAKLI